jgi:steroid delta-isomerase-like uncharacterized protein
MSTEALEANKALVRRLVEGMRPGNLDVIDEVVAADFVHRNPADPTMAPGPAGLKRMEQRWLAAFPDMQTTVDDQFAEGDKVVTRWTGRGTHRGEMFGIAPTGKQIEFTGIFIDRIAGGKIVEHWDEADILGVLQQLGAVPSPQ